MLTHVGFLQQNGLILSEVFLYMERSKNQGKKYIITVHDLHDFNSLTASIGKCVSFFHLNIRSLSKHLDELKAVVSVSKIKFDFIGISDLSRK